MLEVAGIDGFLGNLDEMMEASDSEGAAWSGFIAAWWDRFGTAEVGRERSLRPGDRGDPAPPMIGHTEQARRRPASGMAIKRMRDRVFTSMDASCS